MRGKQLVLEQKTDGCIVPTSHKLNQDGYLRIRDPRYTGKGRAPLVMYHRYLYEKYVGEIPKGYEIHHLCHCRCCCNLSHFLLMKISEHKAYHNSTRWLNGKCRD